MNILGKSILGVLSCVPILTGIAAVVMMLASMNDIAASGGSVGPGELTANMREFMMVAGAGALLSLGLLAFYAWHLLVVRAADDPTQRLLWGLGLLFAGAIVMPIYFYFHFVESETRRQTRPRTRRYDGVAREA